MRRKVRNWAAFLLALALVLGMIPAAYAAGYSITVNAPTGNNLPYWVFEKVGVDSADVLNLTANEGHTLPTNKVARVSLAVGKNKEDEAACGISINGMYYVQSVTLEHPDFFTGTVEIQIGRDAQWSEETWGNITPVEGSNILGRVQFKDGTFTGDVTISVTPMTQQQADAAAKTNQRQVVPKGKYSVSDITEAIDGILAWKRAQQGVAEGQPLLSGELLTYAGSTAADWLPIGLSRYGADINLIADGVYDRGKTADLGRQGLNGWLWGLITLDSMKYTIPAGASYTRTELVKTILSYQLSDDGFNLRVAQGSTADPDITAMAIQSMGPYYRTSTLNVKDPVDRALERLSQLQLDTADFRSWGTRNSESTSQVIISLCSVGIDPQNDPRFVKNGLNLLDALFYYQQEDGGFAHSYELDGGNPSAVPGESDSMATDQALLALVSVWRQAQGMSPLYDFRPGGVSSKILTPEESEVSFAGSYEFTQELQSRVDALPDALSTEDAEEVAFLLERLKMSREFDGYDRYMEKLTAAQEKIDALYAEIESLNADIAAEILPMTDAGLKEKPIVDGIVKRYRALSEHDRELVESWDAVLAVKAQTDAAQRTLLLCIGGAAVVMIGGSILVRRRRESK